MKRILFLLLIISSIAKAQSDDQTKYTYYRYKYGNQEARGQYDSVLKIPFIDTSLFHPSRPGALLMRPADSLIYKWNGVFWGLLVGSGGSGSGTVNSGTQYRIAYYAGTGTAVSQAAAITSNRALISDANGVPTHSTVTNTELGYISGVTSAVQTQINGKEATFTETTQEFTGATSMSITLSNTPKSGKAEMYYLNGIVIQSSNVSRTGTGVTFSGFTREASDIITAKYSY